MKNKENKNKRKNEREDSRGHKPFILSKSGNRKRNCQCSNFHFYILNSLNNIINSYL